MSFFNTTLRSATSIWGNVLMVYGFISTAIIGLFPETQQYFDSIVFGLSGLKMTLMGAINNLFRWRTLADGWRGFFGARS